MSVSTEADEKLAAAREHVREAIANLAAIVVDECPGAQDFKDTFCETMRTCFNDLMAVRNRLK